MSKYQAITLLLILFFFLGILFKKEKENANEITLDAYKALWHEKGESVNIEKLKLLGVDKVTVASNGEEINLNPADFSAWIKRNYPEGFTIESYSIYTFEFFDLWFNSETEFGSETKKQGILTIHARRLIGDWNITKFEIEIY